MSTINFACYVGFWQERSDVTCRDVKPKVLDQWIADKGVSVPVDKRTTEASVKAFLSQEIGVPADHISLDVCQEPVLEKRSVISSDNKAVRWEAGGSGGSNDLMKKVVFTHDGKSSIFFKIHKCGDASHCPITVTVKGLNEPPCNVEISPAMTVAELKKGIADRAKIDVESQRLVFNNKQMPDEKTLEELGVWDGSMIILALRMKPNQSQVAEPLVKEIRTYTNGRQEVVLRD